MARIPGRARLAIWIAALLFAVAVVSIVAMVAGGEIAVEVPSALWVVLLIPILAGVSTLVSLLYAVRIWRKGEGRRTARVLYTLAAVVFCLFLWQMSVWNLLGWNY
jgi:hypothetical protein